MKSLLLTTEYMGPISSYWHVARADEAWVEAHENYQKKSYRNRCQILSPNGVQTLSVPLASGKNSKCPISEVAISYAHDWIDEHSQALLSSYGKAPYYEYYMPDIEAIWAEKKDSLLALNDHLQHYLLQRLSIDTAVTHTTSYVKDYGPEVADLRKSSYSHRAIDPNLPKPYTQVWFDRFGFQPDLSILDLLFCKGPEAGYYL